MFPKQSLLYGALTVNKGSSPFVALARSSSHRKNNSRRRFINIGGAFYTLYYCSAEVGRSHALLPQQHFQARCLQNDCENHSFSPKSYFSYKNLCFFIIFATRSWLPNPGYQILAFTSWLPDPGFHILASTSWLPDIGYDILATWSYLQLSGAICSYLQLSAPICSCLHVPGAICSYLQLAPP